MAREVRPGDKCRDRVELAKYKGSIAGTHHMFRSDRRIHVSVVYYQGFSRCRSAPRCGFSIFEFTHGAVRCGFLIFKNRMRCGAVRCGFHFFKTIRCGAVFLLNGAAAVRCGLYFSTIVQFGAVRICFEQSFPTVRLSVSRGSKPVRLNRSHTV